MEVYIAARDLNGFAIGTHQFIIILSGSMHPVAKLSGKNIYPKNIGNNKMGYVIGAQNIKDLLAVEFFEKSDYQAALEHFEPHRKSFFRSDFDTQVSKVNFLKFSTEDGVRKLLELVNYYSLNQDVDKIKYPTVGFGYNSNSWAQSIIKYSGGEGLDNFNGLDISYDKEIPKTYFTPICPSSPRPRLNK